jgi:DNA anti-recombination protein RmuC
MESTGSQRVRSLTGVRTALTRRFPGHAAVVERLVAECERFRELCEDYLECAVVLNRFEELGDATQQRITEYKDLQAGLEQELLDCIEERATCPHCGRKHKGSNGASNETNPSGSIGVDP